MISMLTLFNKHPSPSEPAQILIFYLIFPTVFVNFPLSLLLYLYNYCLKWGKALSSFPPRANPSYGYYIGVNLSLPAILVMNSLYLKEN